MPDHDQQTKSTILAASTWRNAEREEPIPIDKPAHATRHVVMTLGPGDHAYSRMPDLAPKDRIAASAELEVTVDAKDAADAVRKPYDYAPAIEAELLLAADPQATEEESGRAISLHRLAPVSCNHEEHHRIVYF